jgi:hypothetical protein
MNVWKLKALSASIQHNTGTTVGLVSYARGGCAFVTTCEPRRSSVNMAM